MNQTITLIDEILHALAADQSVVSKDTFHKIKNNTLAKYKTAE